MSEPLTAKLSPHIPTIEEEGYRRDSVSFSELLGTKIASSRYPLREGTKGIYLKVRNTETVVALTCRHVVFGPEEENIDFCRNTHNSRGVVQPGNKTYQHTVEFLHREFSCTNSAIDICKSLTPLPEEKLEDLRSLKVKAEIGLQRHEPFESMESLFELDQKKHQTPLAQLQNTCPSDRMARINANVYVMTLGYLDQERKRRWSCRGNSDVRCPMG